MCKCEERAIVRKPTILCGIGVNDSKYVTKWIGADGRHSGCSFYSVWAGMISRCYNEKVQARYPTYKNCSVCDEWLYFSNFKRWMESQEWEGKELDKDIIIESNKHYSPETCVFVDKRVNSLLIDCGSARGNYPTGVSKFRDRYRAMCQNGERLISLGIYGTPEEARKAYLQGKAGVIYKVAVEQGDDRVSYALKKRAINNLIQTFEGVNHA